VAPVVVTPNAFEAVPAAIAVPAAPAPATTFKRKPAKVVRTRGRRARVVFRFGSNQSRVRFFCRVDRSRFQRCRVRIVRRLRPGRHVIRVKARNADGRTDRTPAVYRFRIKRLR
jgi:hypothetical protein